MSYQFFHLGRIGVGPGEMPEFLANGSSAKAAEALKQIGYAHVTLNLLSYRRGNANEAIPLSATEKRG